MPATTTRALDLFAGAGGWDLAARDLGIHADGVELMAEARATRDAAGLATVHDDVWTVPTWMLALYVMLITSPPCQTFSGAGKGDGRKALRVVLQLIPHVAGYTRQQLRRIGTRATGDERTALVLTPLWYALNMPNVRSLAWEQVPAVLPVWEACADVLRAGGWHVWVGIVYAEQYGVPQTRKRAILIASKDHPVDRPVPTHSRYYSRDPKRLDRGVAKWVSMAESLAGFGLTDRPAPTITGGGTETGGAEPIAKLARYTELPTWQGRSHMGDVRQTNGCVRPVDEPAPTITAAMDNGNHRWVITPAIEGETADDCQWVHDRPSPTVVGSFRPDVVAAPGYRKPGDPPRQRTPGSVRVTVQEAGVLQSFPADHPWQGTKGKQYLQAGNAVPVLMARAVLIEARDGHEALPEARLENLFDLLDAS